MSGREIKRDYYIQRLISLRNNGSIKVISGMRRCGKTYILMRLFYDYLIEEGVSDDHILRVASDDRRNKELRDPDSMLAFIDAHMKDNKTHYVFIDEIQTMDDFAEVLNSLLHMENLDVYVSGSNSKLLSSDIVTEFRGRSDQIRIYPLSFSEFMSVYEGGRVNNASVQIKVTIDANRDVAELLGVGSGNPISEENFTTGSYTSYLGRTIAVIRAGYEEGNFSITASATGLPKAILSLRTVSISNNNQ